MSTFSFTVTDDHAKRLVDAFCGLYRYREMVPNPDSTPANPLPEIPNPETRPEFANRQIKKWIREQVARWEKLEVMTAAAAAAQAAISQIDVK